MQRIVPIAGLAFTSLLWAGCDVGQGKDFQGGGPDAGGSPGADATPGATAALSGTVNDWAAGTPMANAALTTQGLASPLSATSGADGSYELDGMPANSVFAVEVSMAQDYLPTINPDMLYSGTPAVAPLMVLGTADAQRQYDIAGVTLTPGNAIVVAELLKGDGTPREGVLLADVSLVDGVAAPVGDGPYFIGAAGDVDLAVTTSTTYNGKARVVFLNVPPGEHTLTAIYPQNNDDGQNGGGNANKTVAVSAIADAAILTKVNDKSLTGGGGGGGN